LTADVNMLRPSVLAAYGTPPEDLAAYGTPPEGLVTGACALESSDDQVEYDSDGT